MRHHDDPRLSAYWTLTADEQRSLHALLAGAPGRWFLHATGFETLRQICADGFLKPSWPQGTKLDGPYREMLCLTPSDSRLHPGTTKYPPIRLALAAGDLPDDIGLDWSYEPAELIDKLGTNETKLERMMRHILELGCVVSFERIPTRLLRVQTSDVNDPSSWPLLHESQPGDWWWDREVMPPYGTPEFVYPGD